MRALSSHALALIALAVCAHGLDAQQLVLGDAPKVVHSSPCLILGTEWTALGPVPAGMREQAFGANPLTAFGDVVDLMNELPPRLPSAYGYLNGSIAPRRFVPQEPSTSSSSCASHTQRLVLAYPEVDWKGMRSTAGWSALQWQALLWTELNVAAPGPVALHVNVDKAIEFAFVAEGDATGEQLRWYTGDVYSYNQAAPPMSSTESMSSSHTKQPLPLAHLIELNPGRYRLVLRAVYEIRLFGDPDSQSSDGTPQLQLKIDVQLRKEAAVRLTVDPPLGRAPDIVGEELAGQGVAVGVRNGGVSAVQIEKAGVHGEMSRCLSASLSDTVSIAAAQTRSVVVDLHETRPLSTCIGDHTTETVILSLRVLVKLLDSGEAREEQVDIQLRRLPALDVKKAQPFVFTFRGADGALDYASALPPAQRSSTPQSVVLALHGAGVDAADSAWSGAIRQQSHSWVIFPSGRTSWGFDWQLASLASASAAVRSMAAAQWGVDKHLRAAYALDPSKLYVVGHSNGGQGALYRLSRFPDEVIGGTIAAGYIKMRDYVSFEWSASRQSADPALAGILASSLSMFENDLHASNLAGVPLLIKYGSADDNVPPWHSRSLAALVDSWNAASRLVLGEHVQVSEAPGKGHWWPEVLREADVQAHIETHLRRASLSPLDSFTLSTTNPHEAGAKQGVRILALDTPGRLGRLEVTFSNTTMSITSSGVQSFSLTSDGAKAWHTSSATALRIDGQALELSSSEAFAGTARNFECRDSTWHAVSTSSLGRPQGPLLRIWLSAAPLQLVLPTRTSRERREAFHSAALRLAHAALLFVQLDSRIVDDVDAIRPEGLTRGSLIVLGGADENLLAEKMLRERPAPFSFLPASQLRLHSRVFSGAWTLLSLLPHPTDPDEGLALVVAASAHAGGLERGVRALQQTLRTGAQLPEWVLFGGAERDWMGAGGLLGAGWYDADWRWSHAMSWLS